MDARTSDLKSVISDLHEADVARRCASTLRRGSRTPLGCPDEPLDTLRSNRVARVRSRVLSAYPSCWDDHI